MMHIHSNNKIDKRINVQTYKRIKTTTKRFLPARHYTRAVLVTALFLSVCSCLSQVGVLPKGLDGLTWFLTRRLHSSSPTLRYKEILLSIKSRHFRLEVSTKLRTQKISPRHIDRRKVLSIQLDKCGRSVRDKLDRRRSTKLTVHATFGSQFITVIVKLCVARDSVARVHQRQLTLVRMQRNIPEDIQLVDKCEFVSCRINYPCSTPVYNAAS